MSMFGNASPSVADIAAITGRNNSNGGFGGDNGWWVLIILFALFGGFGNNGYGRNSSGGESGGTTIVTVPTGGYGCMGGGNYSGFMSAEIQRGFDNQTLISKIDQQTYGISSLGYDQLAQINGVNNNITQQGFAIQQAINNNTVAGMQNTNQLSAQQSDCCCKTQTGFMNVINNMDRIACDTNTNIHMSSDAIINNQNQGFQMLNQTIKDGFCNLEMREMQRENRDLRDRLQDQRLNSSLQETATYILSNTNPQPRPAWIVDNPNGCNRSWVNTGCRACA